MMKNGNDCAHEKADIEELLSSETLTVLRKRNVLDIILEHCSTKLILSNHHTKSIIDKESE